jgi:hypothetical protein
MNFWSKLLQGIAFVPTVVTCIENLFGTSRSGAEKKDAALSFVQEALSAAEFLSNRQIVDEAKFRHGLGLVVDGTVECLNASLWAKPGAVAPQK